MTRLNNFETENSRKIKTTNLGRTKEGEKKRCVPRIWGASEREHRKAGHGVGVTFSAMKQRAKPSERKGDRPTGEKNGDVTLLIGDGELGVRHKSRSGADNRSSLGVRNKELPEHKKKKKKVIPLRS